MRPISEIDRPNELCYRLAAAPKKHIKHTSQSENRSFGGVFPTYDSIHVTPPVSLFFFHDRWDIRVFPSRPLFFFFRSRNALGPVEIWYGWGGRKMSENHSSQPPPLNA